MNRLKMAEVQAILTLASKGWSFRRVAEALGIDRETVARYVREARDPPKPAKAPTGSGVPASRRSACEPFRAIIQSKLEQQLSAQRIWQDLVGEHNATVSYYSVRRFGLASPLFV